MKTMNLLKASALLTAAIFVTTSCLDNGDDTIVLENNYTNVTGIPDDNLAEENPTIDVQTTTIPNLQYTVEQEGNDYIVRIDMTGVQDAETKEWMRLIGTAQQSQNVWLSIDGTPKGISVHNTADDEEEDKDPVVDLVFLVDNSGSMSEEAEAIARDITSWTEKLVSSGLDIRFGCVGYGRNVGANGYRYLVDDYGVYGALDLTTHTNIDEYLNGRGMMGINRTVGYYGSNAAALTDAAVAYSKAGGECGVQALRFADENFSFRKGSNHIYVNFTDDYNFPGNYIGWSVQFVADKWTVDKGTIHSVISNDTTYFEETPLIKEKAWAMSAYTGGTVLTAPSNFSGVTLESLPVTGAMVNSYVIRFTNISKYLDGQPHLVKITILSADGKTKAEKTFYMTFTVPENEE